MSLITRIALRVVSRMDAEAMSAADLDAAVPVLEDAMERLQDRQGASDR